MAGQFSERYPLKDFRLQRRISHPFGKLVQTIVSASGDETRTALVQKIFGTDPSEKLPSPLKLKFFDSILNDLKNFNSDVFELSFNLHLKLVRSCPKEFASLCFRNVVYTSIALSELHQNRSKIRVEVEDPVLTRLLYLLKFAYTIFNFIMSNALLFSETEITDVCYYMIKLLCHKEDHVLTPFNLMCWMDRFSKWSLSVLSNRRTRYSFFCALQDHPELIGSLLTVIKDWFHTPSIPSNNETENMTALDQSIVKFPNFLSSFCTLVNICKYKWSRHLFPVSVAERKYEFSFLLLITFEFFKKSKCMHSIPTNIVCLIAKILGTIFSNTACIEPTILNSMFEDVQLWVLPLIILLSSIMNYEMSTISFLLALERRVLNDREGDEISNLQGNAMAKSLCKLIANALNLMARDKDEEIARHLDSIFNTLFFQSHVCHVLMKEDQKFFPHIMHIFHNDAPCGRTYMQEVLLRCIQRVLPVIIFSPNCFSLLEENYAVPDIMSFIEFQKIFDNSCWKSTLFTLTSVLRNSRIFTIERNILIKKALNSFINLLDYEAILNVAEEQKHLLFIIYNLTHDTDALITVMEIPDCESEVTITDECEEVPITLLEFINISSGSQDLGSRVHETGVKIVRNIMASLDSYLCLQHNLDVIAKMKEAVQFPDRADAKETLKITENIIEIFYYNTRQDDENVDSLNLSELYQALMDGGDENTIMQFFSHKVNFQLDEFEKIILHLKTKTASQGSIKFDWTPVYGELSPEDNHGIEFMLKYGALIKMRFGDLEGLTEDLKHLQKCSKRALNLDLEIFSSYNWFFSMIYFLFETNIARTQKCLSLLMQHKVCEYLWLRVTSPSNDWAVLDYMISKELNYLCFHLQKLGISIWVLCQRWAKECFMKILPWAELKVLLVFLVLHPSRYLFYFFITFLKENEEVILENFKRGNLMLSLDELSYSLSENIPQIMELNKKYHLIL